MTSVQTRACRLRPKLVSSSWPSPWFIQRSPSARKVSPGPGRMGRGELAQKARARAACAAMRIRITWRETARLGAKTAAQSLPLMAVEASRVPSARDPQHDLHAPVLGPALGGGVGGDRVLLAVREDAEAAARGSWPATAAPATASPRRRAPRRASCWRAGRPGCRCGRAPRPRWRWPPAGRAGADRARRWAPRREGGPAGVEVDLPGAPAHHRLASARPAVKVGISACHARAAGAPGHRLDVARCPGSPRPGSSWAPGRGTGATTMSPKTL